MTKCYLLAKAWQKSLKWDPVTIWNYEKEWNAQISGHEYGHLTSIGDEQAE
jgi:hypothetical protein